MGFEPRQIKEGLNYDGYLKDFLREGERI